MRIKFFLLTAVQLGLLAIIPVCGQDRKRVAARERERAEAKEKEAKANPKLDAGKDRIQRDSDKLSKSGDDLSAGADRPQSFSDRRVADARKVELECAKSQTRAERETALGTDPKRGYQAGEGRAGAGIEAQYGYFRRSEHEGAEWVSLSGKYGGDIRPDGGTGEGNGEHAQGGRVYPLALLAHREVRLHGGGDTQHDS
jgi:hypothetical protein